MFGVLVDEWMGNDESLPVVDEASVSSARLHAKAVAAAQGLSTVEGERLATIASELARNQLNHARRGQIAVRPIARGAVRGVEIVAADEGRGIQDPTRALAGAPRISGSLGAGLKATREHATEVDFDVRLEEGTCVRARIFPAGTPRRREVGVFGRPYRGEPRSGDHACVHRADDQLLLGVCDGLGHGAPARTAAGAAIRVFITHRSASPHQIIEECHRALGQTRGVVMAAVALDERPTNTMNLAAVGNITVEFVRPLSSRRFGATSFVVGAPRRGWRAHVETATATDDEVLVLFTDGIKARTSIGEDRALLREHPITIAHQLVERFAREDDDVLVLVAR